jgi:hypothetical protein
LAVAEQRVVGHIGYVTYRGIEMLGWILLLVLALEKMSAVVATNARVIILFDSVVVESKVKGLKVVAQRV